MVDVKQGIATRFPVNLRTHIGLKGYINGNYGEFTIEWLKVAAADAQAPGEPIIRTTTVGGEDFSVDAVGNDELGYGVVEMDKNQIDIITDEYAAGDLIPILPWHSNSGMIFQGWVLDTDGDKGPDHYYDYGAVGFSIADLANKVYAQQLYFVADTGAVPQHLVLYASVGGPGG